MDDRELAQKRADLAGKYDLIIEKTAEARELTAESAELITEAHGLAREISEEEERRRNHPGADVREFRPRPSNGPTDQGTC